MIYLLYASLLLILAALPVLMVARNLPLFHRAAASNASDSTPVSVLIPARDEEQGIADAVQSILENGHVELEVIVMDDHSTDRTAAIVAELAREERRLRLVSAPDLPVGWNGKQHACWQLAQLACYERLLFIDADVRLTSDGVGRMLAEHEQSGSALLSGFPRQVTPSWSERLLIPMMHVVLLGYLPLDRMRAGTQPELGAGCGQLFLTARTDYMAVGGHAAIRLSRHDGLQLPRAYRRAGLATDLFDASDIAAVRMYSGWRSVLRGLLKNATEGIANVKLIGIFSLLLLGAAVLPVLSLAHALFYGWPTVASVVLAVASLLSFVPRLLIALRLRQSWLGVLLHPVAVAIFVAVQWIAFVRANCGWGEVAWKGRV